MIARTRVAYPTASLSKIEAFYSAALGLPTVGSFSDHEGYSGIIFGFPDGGHQLEFTKADGAVHEPESSAETLLVLYVDSRESFESIVAALDLLPARRVVSANPYWERNGVTFLDPDGRRVVISRASQ